MALDATSLADALKAGLGFTEATTAQLSGLAQDIVDHIGTAVFSNLLGTVTGEAPPTGGPLANGAASNGVIVLVPSDLETRFNATFGTSTSEISGFATAFSTHIASALVTFVAGNITGTCTNVGPPTPAPGVLLGEGANGILEGLDAPTLAALISSSIGQSGTTGRLDGFSESLVTEVSDNAEATYLVGSVTGVAPSGGGPITLGAGTGGTIS